MNSIYAVVDINNYSTLLQCATLEEAKQYAEKCIENHEYWADELYIEYREIVARPDVICTIMWNE